MSNLIKSVYFNVDPSKVRVIDSDERVEEYIPTIYDEPKQAEAFMFPQLEDDMASGDVMADFMDGMPKLISIQDVVDEEREKLARQMQEEQESAMNAAREDAIREAREEAQQIIERAQMEADSIREEAHNQGFMAGQEEGRTEAEEELVQLRAQLQEEYQRKAQELEQQAEALEPAFADLVVNLVRKLTGVVCEDKKDVILYLIGSALKNKEKTNQIVIRVSKEDMTRVSAKKTTLRMIAGEVSEFDIIEDESLSENQCIIETDNKIIDCSLDVQLQNLEEHVKMLVF